MKWFYDMKIGKKLIGGFLLVAAIAVTIGLIGYMNIKKLAEQKMPSQEALLTLADAESRVIIGERGLLIRRLFTDPKTRDAQYVFMDQAFKEMDDSKKTYESLPMGTEEERLWKEYTSLWDSWKKDHDAMLALADGKAKFVDTGVAVEDARMTDLDTKLMEASLASRASWLASNETLKKLKVAANEAATQAARASQMLMLVLMVIGGLIAVILGVFISRIISRPISDLAAIADKLALGDMNVTVEAETNDEIGDLTRSFEKMIDSIKDKAAAAEQIAAGNLAVEIEARSANDVLANSMKQVVASLRALTTEAGMLTNAAVDGKLDTRGNAENFKGGYRDIVKGINDTLDAVIGPLNMAAEYIDRISKGDIPPKITESYRGDFNEIKNNVNMCIDAIGALVNDANTSVKAAVDGKLDVRADVAKHQGDFRKIMQGLNDTMDAVIGPLNVAAEYIDRISKGDIPPKVTDSYNGDFNEIKNNLNQCIDGLGGLVEANDVLQKMAMNDYTVPVSGKYQGVYSQVAHAVNEVQDRINHTIRILGNISHGDLNELDNLRQIGNGTGRRCEKDELVPTAIRMMENIKKLVDDAEYLSKSSVEGKLDVRADISKHEGDYQKVIAGINDTLDAVIGPLNVAAEYIDRISKGDIPPKITDSYNGDFNEIKNNLNQCIDGLGGLVEANAVLQRMTTNDYSVQVKGQYQGVFAEVGHAVNEVQERINHVIATVTLVSRGDLKDLESYRQIGNGKGRRSDNDELVPSLIRMMDSIKRLVDDAENLSSAAVEGRLSTRADVTKHDGDFRKVVAGVNETLDAVIEPVNEAVSVIESMAEGDLSGKVTGDYRGDHAKMKDALNRTLESLNDILGQVNVASEQVVSGSAQVSDSSQSLSQGATESASSLEEITSSMTEMTSQTKQNADNAQQANKLAAAARDNAEQGNNRMGQMLDAMREINESSGQISKIIKVIDEIAFQTNLLALNAAVEAARAGVHGKGFAVVADEVRNLAQRSAKAAKETTELIETSIKKVENGTGIANETAKALTEIVSGVTKVTDLVGEIASASNEQAQGISQVNQGLGQIDQVTQANTANAEESAAAAEELSGQASNLKQMITRFRLANTMTMVRSFDSFQSDHQESPRGMKALPAGMAKGSKGGRKSASKDGRSSSNPADIIALDDEDFGKF